MEDNLCAAVTVKEVSDIAFSSMSHFQRIFYLLTGFTITDYLRYRRLTVAAFDLLEGNKVIDVALKYQYDSPESFSRAFKKFHGFNPSEVKKNQSIRSFQKLIIKITVEGDVEMKYRIETKPALTFLGDKRTFNITNGENFIGIPKYWGEVMENGVFNELMTLNTQNNSLGVCLPMNEDGLSFDYVIGVFSPDTNTKYESFTADENEYVVFELTGPMSETIQPAWKRIFSEWFPATNYQPANAPQFEVYMDGDINAEDYYMEIWIPITK
jgi:AraC family transcriptional regulator